MCKNMRGERARRGMTARQVADAIGTSENSVLNWENGVAEPRSQSLMKLARLYECSPEYLLGMTNDRLAPIPKR